MRRSTHGLPPPRYRVTWEPALPVPGADGNTLLADHYAPVTDTPCPTLLVRSPYGRGFPWSTLYGLAFAEQGFHVVLQSCRGTAGSLGTFDYCRGEVEDGHAAVAWLRRQPWFSGRFGTIGPSYLAYTQWAMAAEAPPEFAAAVIQVGMHRPYDVFYEGGVFALDMALAGGVSTAFSHRGLMPMLRALTHLHLQRQRITRALPLPSALNEAFGDHLPFAREFLAQTNPDDPYWQAIDLTATLQQMRIPTALIGGWYDINLNQTLEAYQFLRRGGCDVTLQIGPWTHTSLMSAGLGPVFAHSLAWLRRHLCGETEIDRPAPVRVFVGGRGAWRDLEDWPPAAVDQAWYVGSPGQLGTDGPGHGPTVLLRYDPADPTPSVGGSTLAQDAGPRDNRRLEARRDVATFTSGPLVTDLEVLGAVHADLHVSASGPQLHVFARLCEVFPDGRSINICDGVHRLAPVPAGVAHIRIGMSSIAHRFAAGHRLRVLIAGGAFPRFARNLGNLEPIATATRLTPTEFVIHAAGTPPSAIHLPVVSVP